MHNTLSGCKAPTAASAGNMTHLGVGRPVLMFEAAFVVHVQRQRGDYQGGGGKVD
jgi:predicted RNase H-like nuclease (RuvC/YqgF family)